MKDKLVALALVSLVSIPVLAAQTKAKPMPRTPVANAEFVSYDAKTKMVTVKDDKGQTSSATLEKHALSEVTKLHLKNGDHVMLTYRDNAKGEHQAVIDIKPAKAKA